MVSNEYKEVKIERCSTCNQEQFKVMNKFREYLFKYVTSNKQTKNEINEIYSFRSKIAHTGKLLHGDGLIDWSKNDEKYEQQQIHIKAMQIARLSLINWILRHKANPKN